MLCRGYVPSKQISHLPLALHARAAQTISAFLSFRQCSINNGWARRGALFKWKLNDVAWEMVHSLSFNLLCARAPSTICPYNWFWRVLFISDFINWHSSLAVATKFANVITFELQISDHIRHIVGPKNELPSSCTDASTKISSAPQIDVWRWIRYNMQPVCGQGSPHLVSALVFL